MRWKYPGGAECSYHNVVHCINELDVSENDRTKLREEIDYLIGHILSDADGMLRTKYTSYYYRRRNKARELLMDTMKQAMDSIWNLKRRFEKAGYTGGA